MAQCKFCKRLEWEKDHAQRLRQKAGINSYYRVGLIVKHTANGEVLETIHAKDFTMNFCPVCGRKLVKSIRQKKNL